MADKKQQNKGSNGFYTAAILLIVLFGFWALAPEKMFETTWQTEQHEIFDAGGSETNAWILSQSLRVTDGLNKAATDMVKDISQATPTSMAEWEANRIEASIIWTNLIIYRGFILVMWILLGIPLVVAATIDAYYAREIAKEAFVAQSPNRHKIGVNIFHWGHLVLTAWIILPVHLPFLVMPCFTVLIAFSVWIWIRNLQKRL